MTSSPIDFKVLESLIGHVFNDRQLLEIALTHSSSGSEANYERLEFLGDRVLALVIAETLYERFPDEKEGDLAKRLSALVQGSILAKIARSITLGDFIVFSESERRAGGSDNDNILADVFEALLGALYLDAGFVPCRKLIDTLWEDAFFEMKAPPQHPKTALQEWAQGQGLSLPEYEIVAQSGPDHAPIFKIKVSVNGYEPVFAEGASRQTAEKLAASLFIKRHTVS